MADVLSREQRLELVAAYYADPMLFNRTVLHDWFSQEPAPMHYGLTAVLTKRAGWLRKYPAALEWLLENFVQEENPGQPDTRLLPVFSVDSAGDVHMRMGRYVMLMCPRGSSKTTYVAATEIWRTVFLETDFDVMVSATGFFANQQLTNIAKQLSGNKKIQALWGTLKPEQRNADGERIRWAESVGNIETTTGVTLWSRGAGSQVRGMNANAKRPRRLVGDDLEDAESVGTEEQRKKMRDWFFGDLKPALNQLDPDADMVIAGTLLGSEALLRVIEQDPEFTTVKFGAKDRRGRMLWPAWMDEAKFERTKESYASKGLLDVFYREYCNELRPGDRARFKQSYIQIDPAADSYRLRAMAIDPALSKARKASEAVIAVVGMNEANGLINVLDMWGQRGATPRELIDQYFAMHFRWMKGADVFYHGVESIAFQAALVHLLQEEMFRRGREHGSDAYFEITPITHSRNENSKIERIDGILQPRYAAGYMRHQRVFPELQLALLDWPNSRMDWPDALSMAVSLLDDFAVLGAGDGKGDPAADEFEPLGEWRAH